MKRVRMTGLNIAAAALVTAVALMTPSGGPAAAAGKGTVNVGIICTCTGSFGPNNAVAVPAFQAWAKTVNAAGGVNGYKINVIVKDDQSNPGVSLADAQTLINTDHVVALSDITNYDTTWASLAQSAHIPVIGDADSTALPLTNPDFFAAESTVDSFAIGEVEAAKKVGATKLGDFYCSEAPSCSEIVPVLQATTKAVGGLTLAYAKEISASEPNYTAECLAAKQAGVDFLGIGESTSAVLRVMSDCVTQGFTPWGYLNDGLVEPADLTAPGLDTKTIGFETDFPFYLTSTPGMKKYLKAVRKYAPQILTSEFYGEQPVAMYAAGLLLGQALTIGTAGKSGPVTTAEILKGLYSIHQDTLGGVAPPLTFTEGKANPVDCWYWIGIKNHKFTTPYGTKPFCKSPPAGT